MNVSMTLPTPEVDPNTSGIGPVSDNPATPLDLDTVATAGVGTTPATREADAELAVRGRVGV